MAYSERFRLRQTYPCDASHIRTAPSSADFDAVLVPCALQSNQYENDWKSK